MFKIIGDLMFIVLLSFKFGVGYAVKGYARIVSELGAEWVRIPVVAWGRIEPLPPVDGKHSYRWQELDALICEYQKEGFEVQLILKAANPWACKGIASDKRERFRQSYPPSSQYWDDYGEFVYNVVERYDGDGYKDAPCLLKPVLYYEIESEAHNSIFWKGTVEDYGKLLKIASTSARKANGDVKIILAGINFGNFLEHCNTFQDIKKVVASLKGQFRRSYEFILKSLSYGEYYDIVDLHFNRGYRSILLAVAWMRELLKQYGYSDKIIWAGDVCSVPWITDRRLFKTIADPSAPFHDIAIRWLRRKQVEYSVKKLVLSIAAGIDAFFLESIRDFSITGYRNAWKESFVFAGLIDNEFRPRPVFYAYRETIRKIKGFWKVSLEMDKGLYIVRFNFPDSSMLMVIWSDSGKSKFNVPFKRVVEITDPLGRRKPFSSDFIIVDSMPVFVKFRPAE